MEVADVAVSEAELYAGKPFVIKARTAAPAEQVSIEIGGRQHVMDGTGTEWKYLATVPQVGPSRYQLVARNTVEAVRNHGRDHGLGLET